MKIQYNLIKEVLENHRNIFVSISPKNEIIHDLVDELRKEYGANIYAIEDYLGLNVFKDRIEMYFALSDTSERVEWNERHQPSVILYFDDANNWDTEKFAIDIDYEITPER